MNNLDKKHIEIFREYFLSHNEDVRQSIRNILPGALLKYLSIIETGFLRNTTVENIASEIGATHLILDLRQLQTDYHSSLEQTFENELAYAIKATERAAFKKKFEAIDLEEKFQIHKFEIKSAITSVERESIKEKFERIDKVPGIKQNPAASMISIKRIVKYAAAAAIIGFVFIGGYYIISNKKTTDSNLAEKEKIQQPATITIPDIAEQQRLMTLLVPESFGFVKADKIRMTVVIQNVGKQLDTLRKIYVKEVEGRHTAGYGPIAKQITGQIDSLTAIENTYSYDVNNKKIVLRLPNEQTVDKIISTNPSQNASLYIKINNIYYLLKATEVPKKLIPVEDKTTIEELERIIFQNT